MSRRRNYSPGSMAVMGRFFEALDRCVALGLVKNESRFCADNGIDRRNLYHQRMDPGRGYFEAGWLLPLVGLGVSPRWLLTGEGGMLT